MTNKPQKYIKQLKGLRDGRDTEFNHARADDILCEFLEQLGYSEIVSEYKKIHKWYA